MTLGDCHAFNNDCERKAAYYIPPQGVKGLLLTDVCSKCLKELKIAFNIKTKTVRWK